MCWHFSINPNEPMFFLLNKTMPKRISPIPDEYGFIVSF